MGLFCHPPFLYFNRAHKSNAPSNSIYTQYLVQCDKILIRMKNVLVLNDKAVGAHYGIVAWRSTRVS